jgi:hypothetical protein
VQAIGLFYVAAVTAIDLVRKLFSDNHFRQIALFATAARLGFQKVGTKSVHERATRSTRLIPEDSPIMKLWLQPSWPLDDEREILVDRYPFVIGRRSDNDWALPLAFVSRRHCQFILTENQVLVQDLESHNGTFVNGRRASLPLPVRNGDEVHLGPCGFRVVMSAARHETAEAIHDPTQRDECVEPCEEQGQSTAIKG